MEITLELNESEWCELINAVNSRANQIEAIPHSDLADMTEDQQVAWSEELRGIEKKLAEKLDEKGLVY